MLKPLTMVNACLALTLILAATAPILSGAFVPKLPSSEVGRSLDCETCSGHIRRHASAKDEEIARLEEEIRRLREEIPAESMSEEEEASESAFEVARAVAEKKRLLAEVRGKDMLLTEGTLIQENILASEASVTTFGLMPALLGAMLAAGVIAFSQVPIGQDNLSRYSVQAGPTVSTKIDLGDINPDRPRP
jgi:hypothetical protein